jgi:outer membrane lipoprotein carrier protein
MIFDTRYLLRNGVYNRMKISSFRFWVCLLVVLTIVVTSHSTLYACGAPTETESVPASTAAPSTPSVTDIVARLQARYDDTLGFQADFVQDVATATLGQAMTSTGEVFFKKPGKMRWNFSQPAQLLVSDGSSFWFYQPADKQVVKTPFHQAFRSNTPVSFLTGVGRLEDDFQVALQDSTSDSTQNSTQDTYLLQLTSKQDAEAVGRLTLAVSRQTFDIVEATVTDPLGNTTRLRFNNINRNVPLEDSLFQFDIPPGVDIIEPFPSS